MLVKVGWALTFGMALLKIIGLISVTWLQVIAPAAIVSVIWLILFLLVVFGIYASKK